MASSNLAYFASIQVGKKLYVSNVRYNGLFSIDTDTEEIVFLGRFPGYEDDFLGLHSSVILYDNALIFFPELGHSIDVFYIDEQKFESYKIKPWIEKGKSCVCAGVFEEGKYIYLFPRYYNQPVVKVSKLDFSMESLNVLTKIIENQTIKDDILTLNFSSEQGKTYFGIYNTNVFCVLNQINEINSYKINDINVIKSITYKDGNFWILSENELIEWNGTIRKRIARIFDETEKNMSISSMVVIDNVIAILPTWEEMLIIVSKETGEVTKYDYPKEFLLYPKDEIIKWRRFREIRACGDWLRIPPACLKFEIWFNVRKRYFKMQEYVLVDGHPQFNSANVCNEGSIYNFLDFLNYLKSTEFDKKKDIELGCIGKQIFREITDV